jgi:hypothetical protein
VAGGSRQLPVASSGGGLAAIDPRSTVDRIRPAAPSGLDLPSHSDQ